MYFVSCWRLDRRNDFGELDGDRRGAAADGDLLRLGVEIAGRDVPVLALAHVGMQLDGLAIAAMEGLVLVQHGLHGVLAGRHVFEAANGIAVCCGDRRACGCPPSSHRR